MYCRYCGKYLQDGETCSCETSRVETEQPPAGGAAQEQPSNGLTDIFSRLMQYPKRVITAGVVLLLVAMVMIGLSSNAKNKRLIGHWKINPDSIGYGVSLVVDKNSIDVRGDAVNRFGGMIFKYEVISDTELVLEYDWTFDQWIWDFPRANKIPVTYSVSEDGTTLSLYWAGTNFVLLDNVRNFQNGIGSKSCLLMGEGGSLIVKKVK